MEFCSPVKYGYYLTKLDVAAQISMTSHFKREVAVATNMSI